VGVFASKSQKAKGSNDSNESQTLDAYKDVPLDVLEWIFVGIEPLHKQEARQTVQH
jgi:hypothetical protein